MLARLKYDPFKFFAESPSIYGPLAKRRAKKPFTDHDTKTVTQFVARMKETQEADGSWSGALSA